MFSIMFLIALSLLDASFFAFDSMNHPVPTKNVSTNLLFMLFVWISIYLLQLPDMGPRFKIPQEAHAILAVEGVNRLFVSKQIV